jgi:hypothetical protein
VIINIQQRRIERNLIEDFIQLLLIQTPLLRTQRSRSRSRGRGRGRVGIEKRGLIQLNKNKNNHYNILSKNYFTFNGP